MKSRRVRVCKWCMHPLPDWSEVWPTRPGIYLFYGYPRNKKMDGKPRTIMVTVEAVNEIFGVIYRTQHTTMKKATGAAGFFMPVVVPEEFPTKAALELEADRRDMETGRLTMKKLKRRLSDEFKRR